MGSSELHATAIHASVWQQEVVTIFEVDSIVFSTFESTDEKTSDQNISIKSCSKYVNLNSNLVRYWTLRVLHLKTPA